MTLLPPRDLKLPIAAFYTGRSQPDLHCIPQVLCASSVAHVGTVDLKAPSSYSVDILSNEVLKAYVVVRGVSFPVLALATSDQLRRLTNL